MTFEAKKNVIVRTLTGSFLKVPKINEDLPEKGVNLNFSRVQNNDIESLELLRVFLAA